MKTPLLILSCIVVVWFPADAGAQSTFTLNAIPLNKPVKVKLLGADKELLYCYNLYGFIYFDGTDSVTGEFVVPKEEDVYKDKDEAIIKFCRIREFSISVGGTCRAIPVETAIQINRRNNKDEVYLNFDPDGPDPVFMPCK